METERNFANIARRVTDPDNDGQNVQQFMSDSPWSAQAVMQQVQREIAATPELRTVGCCSWMRVQMRRPVPSVLEPVASITGDWARSR